MSVEKGSMYGYVRVSTRDQNEDRQMISMSEMGIDSLQFM